jgi:hypothetical protein
MKIYPLFISGFAGILCVVLVLGILHFQADAASLQNSHKDDVNNALDYLLTQQVTQTGGYGTDYLTAESTLSIGSSELNASDWQADINGRSLMDYWLLNGNTYANYSSGESGKLALGLVASNGCWPYSAFKPSKYYSPTSGIYDPDSINQAFAILGEAALSNTIPGEAINYLRGKIQLNGAWEYKDGYGTDTNTTAIVIQALLSSGENVATTEVISGLIYLKSAQNTDGGFTYDPLSNYGTDSDTNSTAYAVQAILAAGEDPTAGRWVISSTNPISYLLSMQLADGSFEYQTGGGSNLLATQQAIPALNLKFYPFKTGEIDQCPITFLPTVFQ